MKISRLLVFVPALAGLAISTMMNLGDTSVPILHIRIDIGTLLLIIGILISVILLLTTYLRDWSEGVVSSAAYQSVSDRR